MFKVWQRPFVVKRPVQTKYNLDGTPEESEYEDINIKANLQPASSELLQVMPEGNRNKDIYVLYTKTELRTARAESHDADIVVIKDRDFKVFKVDNWDADKVLSHYKVVVINDIVTTSNE